MNYENLLQREFYKERNTINNNNKLMEVYIPSKRRCGFKKVVMKL